MNSIKKRATGQHEYVIEGDSVVLFIPTAKSSIVYKAFIDKADLDKVLKYRWHIHNGYARHKSHKHGGFFMHTLIYGDKGVDHADNNRLNNRKDNLRKATHSQNSSNTKRVGRNKYRGVEITKYGRYRASVCVERTFIRVGNFMTAEEAAYVYDQLAMQIFGDFSITNFEY